MCVYICVCRWVAVGVRGEDQAMTGESPHKGPVIHKAFPCHDVIMPVVDDETHA